MKVPDLIGATRDDAIARLDALGLRADVEEEGGLLDTLLGGDWIVCASPPPRAVTCGGGPASTSPSPRPAEPDLAIGRGGNEAHSGAALLALHPEGDPARDRLSAQP